MIDRKANREEYLKALNSLEGLELIDAVAKSIYKKFRGYGLKKLGIDSLDEVRNIVYIFSRESEEVTFISLLRDWIDYYRKSSLSVTDGNSEITEILTDDYSASEILIRDLKEYLESLDFNVELFERVFMKGEKPKPLFEELGIDSYFGYREIRRVRAKVTGFLRSY